MKERSAEIQRNTRETRIQCRLLIDGSGTSDIETGIPFLNHMLELFTKHSLVDLTLRAEGDLEVDYHHTVEDVGIVLGDAINQALGDRAGIRRYGWALLPMDDAMSRVAVDLGGRPFLVLEVNHPERKIRDFDLQLIEEFFRGFTVQARMNLHATTLYGKDIHHLYESIFKGLAKAFDLACQRDPRVKGLPSTKDLI